MNSLFRLAAALAFWAALLPSAEAACQGRDLIAALPEAERSALAAQDAVPFATGNLWSATRGADRLLLVGTFHLSDPRLDAIADPLAAPLGQARQLLVELSPQDEARFTAYLASHPETVFDQAGPSLKERLSPADWEALSRAVAARGTPPAAVLKMRPWVVSSMLEVPVCAGARSAGLTEGLDHRLTAEATARGLPIRSLEPFDTALRVFDSLSPGDQLEGIRQALLYDEATAEDMYATMIGAYLRGESRLYLAFARQDFLTRTDLTQAELDAQFERVFTPLLDQRNATWIPVLEAAAAEGPTVAAFGALHLSGEKGVLNLLAQDGWTVTPWEPGAAWP